MIHHQTDPFLKPFHSFLLFYAYFALNCRTTERHLLPFKKEKAVKVAARGSFVALFSCRKKTDALECITFCPVPGQMSSSGSRMRPR